MDAKELGQLLGTVSTVWFFLFFVGMLLWVFWPSRKPHMDRQANIPLNDDER